MLDADVCDTEAVDDDSPVDVSVVSAVLGSVLCVLIEEAPVVEGNSLDTVFVCADEVVSDV